jgi:AGCS family alanine or glycine:cation symporter
VIVALVVLGGIKSIGRVTGLFVPTMILLYMAGSVIVLAFHIDAVPHALGLVFGNAFSGTSAAGGFLGATLAQAMRYGIARGIFSNESGLGSAGIAAAAAQTTEPVRQAMVSMTQTFIDTIVVCTLTGLAIIATGVWNSGAAPGVLTQMAFDTTFGGGLGSIMVALAIVMFAFSTILGWCYYGERSVEYLFGEWAILPYRVLFVVAAFIGAVRTVDFVWVFSDVMNGLMALPNLVGLVLLSGVAVRETRSFFERNPHV